MGNSSRSPTRPSSSASSSTSTLTNSSKSSRQPASRTERTHAHSKMTWHRQVSTTSPRPRPPSDTDPRATSSTRARMRRRRPRGQQPLAPAISWSPKEGLPPRCREGRERFRAGMLRQCRLGTRHRRGSKRRPRPPSAGGNGMPRAWPTRTMASSSTIRLPTAVPAMERGKSADLGMSRRWMPPLGGRPPGASLC